jgi:hypothetical protein
MTQTYRPMVAVALVTLSLSLLTACGSDGGDGDGDATNSTPPGTTVGNASLPGVDLSLAHVGANDIRIQTAIPSSIARLDLADGDSWDNSTPCAVTVQSDGSWLATRPAQARESVLVSAELADGNIVEVAFASDMIP